MLLRSTATQLFLVNVVGSGVLAALLYSPGSAFDSVGTLTLIALFPLTDGLQPKSRVKFQRWAYMLVGLHNLYSSYGMLAQEVSESEDGKQQSLTIKPPGFKRPVSLLAIRAAFLFNMGTILLQACISAWLWPEQLNFTVGEAVGNMRLTRNISDVKH